MGEDRIRGEENGAWVKVEDTTRKGLEPKPRHLVTLLSGGLGIRGFGVPE